MTKERKISIICHSIAFSIVVALMIFLCFKNEDGIYYDLAIDHAIGDATNGFGIFFVIVGEYPQYILAPISGTIMFYAADSIKENKKRIALKIFGCVTVALGFFIWISMGTKVAKIPILPAFGVFGALFYGSICLGVGALVDKQEMSRLLKFALFAITFVITAYLVMTIMKELWSRMRYRDMLKEGNFDGFTPWFKLNVGRTNKVEGYEYTSFPSGHTSSATCIFAICVLPDLYEKLNKKWIRYSLYGVSTAFTVIVAISRLVNTAHFLSDVLIGGAVTYGIFYLLKYLFFRNGYVFKQEETTNDNIQE
ncbi:MAG: phosphatase PAP2 family protein [Clostridiales bacterium]|nr:phosphatase PAP2 family protein [Clostridiales bacterium]